MEEQPLKEYEKEHIKLLRENSAECTLFLKQNGSFPIEKSCKVLLAGCGARNTIKGGSGSGDVESRYFTTCEQGLESIGFEIVSKKWLDEYPKFKQEKHKEFITMIKELSEKYKSDPTIFSTGYEQPEVDYELSLDYEADIAVYVIGRNSGEGSDRKPVKGDLLLTDSEVRDILSLNKKFNKFMLVLNTCGVVDLAPVNEVSNILILSQLGVITGDILADIILGKANPSGKLATTWTKLSDYKFINDFGNLDDTKYVEGVYVGYRYFDSVNMKPIYCFGYGKSYTEFEINKDSVKHNKNEINVKVNVSNIGKYAGKEVIQIYVSSPQNNKDKPYQSLVAFSKTKLIKPGEKDLLEIKFKLNDIARYDEESASYILDNGDYIIRCGNSSNNTKVYAVVNLSEDVVIEKLKNIGGKPTFSDFKPEIKYSDDLSSIDTKINLNKNDFELIEIDYNYKEKINENILKYSDEELVHLCVGDFPEPGQKNIQHIVGEAGETTSFIKEIDKYLTMVDGPAGLRITRIYGTDDKGTFRLCFDAINDRMRYYLSPEEFSKLDLQENNKNRKGKISYQYTTTLPIGTAIAQSFNVDFAKLCGDIVGKEMDIFNVQLWLAPAMNIHRNILCGRNFEYYSEDPLIAGKMAGGITLGVQKHKNRGTTIKHFTCNNQEFQRKNTNSIISERALREIYIKGFRIAINDSNPTALMTSYNLINGIHSSERRDLIIDVLRCEWKYQGLVMSDWYNSGENEIGISKYPPSFSTNNILAGNNLQMWGNSINYNDIMKSFKEKKVTRDDLLKNATRVYDTIMKLNQ